VVNVNWDFSDNFMWKAMSQTYVNSLPPSNGIGYLQPSSLIANVGNEEKTLESLLRDKIGSLRMNDERMSTQWDSELSYILGGALSNYELERVGGVTMGNEEFQAAVKNHVPEGHTFKALPVQFTHLDSERMMQHIISNKVGKEVLLARGDQVRLSVRVKIV
jgi:hypothetical protein